MLVTILSKSNVFTPFNPASGTFCWLPLSHFSAPSLLPFSCSLLLPIVRLCSTHFLISDALIQIQANIVPVIATNHTVTIAAELVSTHMSLLFRFTRVLPCRRMECTLLGNAKFPTQSRDPDFFHWKARMSTIRRSALTLSRRR